MHRESDTHDPRRDEELKHQLEGMLRGNGPNRAAEWRDPEPPADDDASPRPPDGAENSDADDAS